MKDKNWTAKHEKLYSMLNKYYQNIDDNIDNYDKISEHKNFKNICDCGGKYTNTNKCRHFNSIIHNNYINKTKNI